MEERKYNYIYKITNLINDKIYIDNLNDGYMGSGKILKCSIKKHGIDNFRKNIIKFYETYKEALDHEREIVNEEFINNTNTYNIRVGGEGGGNFSKEYREIISKNMKKLWSDPLYRKMMKETVYDNPEHSKKLSNRAKSWIENNPEKHKRIPPKTK